MRYIVESVFLDKNHPIWANRQMFFLRDTITGKLSISCYSVFETAQKIADNKNFSE